MALAFRKLSNKRLWDTRAPEEADWLRDELRADALRDLGTKKDSLSIFLIPDRTPLVMSRMISAVCAGGNSLDKCDYALFDTEILTAAGAEINNALGETMDREVNNWHRDLIRLTANRLATVGNAIRKQATFGRMLSKDVKIAIQGSIAGGHIDVALLHENLAKHFT